jgi:hypothetical protein
MILATLIINDSTKNLRKGSIFLVSYSYIVCMIVLNWFTNGGIIINERYQCKTYNKPNNKGEIEKLHKYARKTMHLMTIMKLKH